MHANAFKLFYVIVNFTQILSCSWIVIQIIKFNGINNALFHCQRNEILASTVPHQMLRVCWVYHLLNVLGIFDTVHLKIRGRELIFLHVYHHTIAILWSWLVLKVYPGGHNMLFIFGIASTHAAMYSYYLATLVGINMHRSFFWKLITLLEIGWIVIGLIYMSFLYLYGCPYPSTLLFFAVIASSILLVSFIEVFSNALKKEKHNNDAEMSKQKRK
ncbi:elongation of very long chain fatty acids protein AAEL008004-like [Ischnura elegans]|uniref:elongation of very long chain fatty acids protein AAEL008004-like n=1 Tax=Ischnura elegans TaxID=197161 RepID=UPI001ED88944|nr:elongation of very long chain fatty acids protein AAEL008004-like [Ischnura elegans]